MSKSTISTFQLFEMFPDQETARTYLESRLWPEGPKCRSGGQASPSTACPVADAPAGHSPWG